MARLIVEFCQNHNGDFATLARMVEAAAANGAHYGKIQTIYARELAYRPEFETGLEIEGKVECIKRPYQPEYDRLSGLELSTEEMGRFVALCMDSGLIPMTTCFTRAQVGLVRDLGFEHVKVASYDCASYQLLRELKESFPHLYISTGATFDDEVRYAAEVLQDHSYALLHCVTIYPTPMSAVHLARMEFLRQFAEQVGFSDHSLVSRDGVLASAAAIHLGADLVERHFTILPAGETKDGPVSIGPQELKRLSEFSQMTKSEQNVWLENEHPDWKITVGQAVRNMSDEELLNRAYYRGRFASPRPNNAAGRNMIFNWEETPIK